jgi:hypothetical protein
MVLLLVTEKVVLNKLQKKHLEQYHPFQMLFFQELHVLAETFLILSSYLP